MLYATLLLAVSALASVAFAQDAPNTTACCNIDPGSVQLGTRNGWCTGERNTCLEVCGGIQNLAPNGNLCDPVSVDALLHPQLTIIADLTCAFLFL